MAGVLVGLSNLVVAELLDDPPTGTATYDEVKPIAGAISARINPNSNSATLFADDGPFDSSTTLGEITLELNVADLDLEMQAFLLGHTYEDGKLIRRGADTPPWVAVGFRSLKSNGKYRYSWLLKGKFGQPEQSNQTRGDTIEYNTPTITGAFVKRTCDDQWQVQADEDAAGFTPEIAETWFDAPQ